MATSPTKHPSTRKSPALSSLTICFRYLKEQLQYFMPPQYMVTAKVLKQIFSKQKQLLKASAVQICNPPRYDEVSVKGLYKECMKMPGMAEHFPDDYPKGRSCSREYFFTVLSSKYPEYTQNLILNSKKQRFDGDEEADQQQRIEIDPEWGRGIEKVPSVCQ